MRSIVLGSFAEEGGGREGFERPLPDPTACTGQTIAHIVSSHRMTPGPRRLLPSVFIR